jgi:hypothetical protein
VLTQEVLGAVFVCPIIFRCIEGCIDCLAICLFEAPFDVPRYDANTYDCNRQYPG